MKRLNWEIRGGRKRKWARQREGRAKVKAEGESDEAWGGRNPWERERERAHKRSETNHWRREEEAEDKKGRGKLTGRFSIWGGGNDEERGAFKVSTQSLNKLIPEVLKQNIFISDKTFWLVGNSSYCGSNADWQRVWGAPGGGGSRSLWTGAPHEYFRREIRGETPADTCASLGSGNISGSEWGETLKGLSTRSSPDVIMSWPSAALRRLGRSLQKVAQRQLGQCVFSLTLFVNCLKKKDLKYHSTHWISFL